MTPPPVSYTHLDVYKRQDVLYNKEQTLQCAIIDKSIVWYGNINFFDYNTEASNIMRIVDRKIANEMIDILLTEVPGLA